MRNKVEIIFEIKFKTPFHAGTGLSAGLIDCCVKRDINGLLYIPATTFKGCLRNKVEEFINCIYKNEDVPTHIIGPNDLHNNDMLYYFHTTHTLTPVERLFGSVVKPGTLYFENLTMSCEDTSFFKLNNKFAAYDKSLQVESRTRTSVYRSVKTVKHGALFSSEYGLKTLRFKGKIYGSIDGVPFSVIENEKYKDFTYELFFLMTGLKLIDKIAGNKSTGMGQFDYTKLDLTLNKQNIDIEHDLFHDDIFEALSLYEDEANT